MAKCNNGQVDCHNAVKQLDKILIPNGAKILSYEMGILEIVTN